MSKPWPMVPLGDIVQDLTAERLVNINSDDDVVDPTITSSTHLISVAAIQKGIAVKIRKRIRIMPGDLVFSRLHTQNGAFAYADRQYLSTSTFLPLSVNENRIDRRFLFWMLHVRVPTLSASDTVGRETFKPNEILGLMISLPPLPEQKLIVARIEELAAKVEEARDLRLKAVEEARTFGQNSSSRIFEKLIESYPLHPVGELVTVKGGGTPSKANPFYWNGSIPWISPKDMKSRELRDSIDHISEEAIANSAVKLIEPGAVLVVIRGMILVHTFPSATLRATATINQDMKALIPCSALLPEFLNCMFWAYNSRILKLVEKSTHDTRRLDISKLLDLKIGLPPLPEQRRIVAYLDGLQAKVDELKRLQAETSAELDAMLPSILDRAFKGGWRTRESLSQAATVIRKQELETPLEKSGVVPMAEFPEIYPATDTDRAICAAALSIVEQHGTLSSRDHRDALLLATHSEWCKQLLGQKRHRSLASAMKSAPRELFLHKGHPIRWKECRDYLERLGAITIARGTHDQFIHPGAAFASVKAGLPAGTDGVVKYALAAIEHIRELRKNLSSASQDQRKALQAFDQYHEKNKIPA